MTKIVEDTALAVKEEETKELSTRSLSTAARAEVEAAVILAKKFPRNEDEAFGKLMHACSRTSFAEYAAYSFPRGAGIVSGPSVNLAREAARVWKNIEYGLLVVMDNEHERQIRAWAWDKETNTKVFAEDTFAKLIYRKKQGWIKPDERDLRELTNRRGAILIRNCILSIMPKDLIDDAIIHCKNTLRKDAKQDPDKARKNLILAFSQINVTVEILEKKLGHSIKECTEDEIVELRQIYQSIIDGNSKWSEYIEQENGKKESEKGTIDMGSFAPKAEEKKEESESASKNGKTEPEEEKAAKVEETIEQKLKFAQKNLKRTFKKAAVASELSKDLDSAESIDIDALSEDQKKKLYSAVNGMVDKSL